MNKKLFLAAVLLTILYGFSTGQSVYGWRGEGRSGIYAGTSLLKTWPGSGPALIWETEEIGPGFSSATVTADAVYITGSRDGNDILYAFAQDGKKKWETVYGKISRSNYPEARCTPTFYNNKLYVVSGEGDMVCIDRNGKLVWTVNYFRQYGAQAPRFGISESPVVVDNLVIGTPGGNMAAMVAFNTETGKVVWETPSLNEGTHYVNPLLIREGNKKMIVTLATAHVYAVDPANGKMLWKYNYEAANAVQGGRRNHTNTPLYKDGFLLVANGYEQTAVKLKINWDGRPPELVWKNTDLTPHVGGLVLLGNHIFSTTHDNNSMGRWICVDWNTGKTNWINPWYNKGSVISAGGMLYIYEEKTGHVGLMKADPSKMDVVNEFRITKGTGPYWAHPVIDNGRLFIRHGGYLAVYSIK
ncbi:MAG: PQQ-like beta-propeller repeat protein [Bacteroidales bacterium]|nr:PQQ-like beta-propeller repeat protein [Bacteroidales bacterium]